MPKGELSPATVLVTGVSGYVGGRLLPLLESAGLRVRCLARRPEFLSGRVSPATDIVAGDVLDRASLDHALRGIHTAFYLVHAMGSGADFEAEESHGARNFAAAAAAQGVRRIIYLGGLAREDAQLSAHLRSRHEVGRILRESGVPTVELRTSIVLGSGSLSFEMIRALVERLPAMITPRWVNVPTQPIAIDDLLRYLVASIEIPLAESRVFEIGGADRVSYGELMREYARQRGLKRMMIPVPFLTPRLSSLWLGLVTPLYARIGRRLVDSITTATVVTDDSSSRVFNVRPMGMPAAIALALRNEDREFAATRWFDAVCSAGPAKQWGGARFGNRILDARSCDVTATPQRVYQQVTRIGGTHGWYGYDWLWHLRGAIDLMIGGVGMRRGSPPAAQLRPGAAVDFWRVESMEPGHRLRLAAEMKVPGRAWLEFEVVPRPGGATLRQTAMFDPVGLGGLLYWYALYPIHRLIFARMLASLAAAAERGPSVDARPASAAPTAR